MGGQKARGEPLPADLERAARLLSLFEAKEESGAPRYSDEELRHFLPLVFLAVADASADLPAAVVELLGLFAAQAGIDPDDSEEQRAEAVRRYYEQHPIHPELLKAFQDFVRSELTAGDADKARAFGAFQGFLDEPRARSALGGGSRPAGTVPAGPLARFSRPDDDE